VVARPSHGFLEVVEAIMNWSTAIRSMNDGRQIGYPDLESDFGEDGALRTDYCFP